VGNGDGILFISHDNGYTWDRIVTPMNNDSLFPYEKFIRGIAVEKNLIYISSLGGGVYKSDSSTFNWLPMNNGLKETSISSLYLFKEKLFAYSGQPHSVYLFDEVDKTWNCVLDSKNRNLFDPFTSHDTTLYCAAGSVIYSTTDYGKTWNEIPFKKVFPYDAFISIEKIAFGGDILFGCDKSGYIVRSEDFAQSWNVIEKGLSMASMPIIESLFSKDGIVLVGYYSGGLRVDTTIKISLDNGVTWRKANFELRSTAQCFTMRGNRIYAGTGDGLIYSDDSLKTWHFVDDLVDIKISDKDVFTKSLAHVAITREITVFNLQGKKLVTVNNKKVEINNLRRYFDNNILANGIYIVSVKELYNQKYYSFFLTL
jgi:hypothetical protein